MKKLIMTALAASVLMFSCSKKNEDTKPASSGNPVEAVGNTTQTSKDFQGQIDEITESLNPTFTQTSPTSGEVNIGDSKLYIEQVGEETYISTPESDGKNFRLKSKLLTVTGATGAAGQFGGVMICISRSNVKEVANFFRKAADKKPNGIWGELFGDETGAIFQSGPTDNYVFKPKLNTKNLPKGFFELNGEISAKATKTTPTGKEVTVTGDASGMFSFKATKLAYNDFGSTNFNYFVTTNFSDKDEINVLGKTYKGTASGKFEQGLVFIVGLGKGSGTPPMNGILISITTDGKTSANLILAAFGKVKVK